MDKKIVVLHHSDLDGYASLWAFLKAKDLSESDVEAISVNYNRQEQVLSENNLAGKDIYIFDFSFSRKEIERLNKENNNLCLIDHHITAEQELGDLSYCHFNDTTCGAINVWVYFSDKELPEFLKYVNAYDMWEMKDTEDQYVCLYLNSIAKTMSAFDDANDKLINNKKYILEIGKMIYDNMHKSSRTIFNSAPSFLLDNEKISWYKDGNAGVPVYNNSEASWTSHWYFQGENSCDKVAFFHFEGDKVMFSLRSKKEADVSDIATSWGGGGHKNAAGFDMEIKKFFEFLKG